MWWDQVQGGQKVQFGICAPEAVSCRALPWRGSSSPHLCYGRQLPLHLTENESWGGWGWVGYAVLYPTPGRVDWDTAVLASSPAPAPAESLPPFLSLLCPTEGVTAPPC